MLRRILLPFLPFAALVPIQGVADTLRIEPAEKAADRTRMPGNSMTMKKVEKWFGKPVRKYPPAGNPPITRRDYPGYSVYLENDRVITSVPDRKGR